MDTPKILHAAIRQYRHNNSDGLVMGFDSDLTEEVVNKLEHEIETLKEQIRQMVEKAADQHLEGYRELGARAAEAENDRDEWKKYAETQSKSAQKNMLMVMEANQRGDEWKRTAKVWYAAYNGQDMPEGQQ